MPSWGFQNAPNAQRLRRGARTRSPSPLRTCVLRRGFFSPKSIARWLRVPSGDTGSSQGPARRGTDARAHRKHTGNPPTPGTGVPTSPPGFWTTLPRIRQSRLPERKCERLHRAWTTSPRMPRKTVQRLTFQEDYGKLLDYGSQNAREKRFPPSPNFRGGKAVGGFLH